MSLANELLVDGFDRGREVVTRAGAGLDEGQLAYRPDRDANSIAWLTWHLSRVQDDHIADVAGAEQIWTAAGWVERFRLPLDVESTGSGPAPAAEQIGPAAGGVERFRLPFDVESIGFGHSSDDVARVRASADMLTSYQDA